MSQFILLLHEDPSTFTSLSPKEIEGAVKEYTEWRDELAKEGRMAGGNKLTDEGGRSLTQNNGSVRVVDGPYSEAKEVIGGYFMINASDYDEAVEISRGCPHLKYGGRIELRAVDNIHD